MRWLQKPVHNEALLPGQCSPPAVSQVRLYVTFASIASRDGCLRAAAAAFGLKKTHKKTKGSGKQALG
jgi:hypothetical protein